MRWARTMSIVVAGVSVARMWTVQPRLPARVASHFDATGAANGWMSPSGLFGFHAALLGILLLVFTVLPRLVRYLPAASINLPNRDYWLAPERRETTLGRIEDWTAALGLAAITVIALLEELVVRANLPGGDGRLPMLPLVGLLVGLLAVVGAGTVRFVRMWRLPPR